MGRLDKDGYGQIKDLGRVVRASAMAYELGIAPVPHGLCVLHTCDVPACVRLEHLYLGTHQQNARDRVTRGRDGQGSKTKCAYGHPYDVLNTYVRPATGQKGRDCR
jgi:hypothetical protein